MVSVINCSDICYAQTIMSGMGELHLEIYAEVGVLSVDCFIIIFHRPAGGTNGVGMGEGEGDYKDKVHTT